MKYYYHSLISDIFRVFRNKIMIIGFVIYLAISFYALWDYGLLISYADYDISSASEDIVRHIDYSDDAYVSFVKKRAEYNQEHSGAVPRSELKKVFSRSSWCPDITVATSDWSIVFFLCFLTDIVISGENVSCLVIDGNTRRRIYKSKIVNTFVIALLFRLLAFMLIYLMNFGLNGMHHSSMLLDYMAAYILGLFPTFCIICAAAMLIFVVWNRFIVYIIEIAYPYIQMLIAVYLITRKGIVRPDILDYSMMGMMSAVFFKADVGFKFLCMFYPVVVFFVTYFIGYSFFKRRTLK